MGELRPWHIIVLVVVVFVLFGYKKLPDATRSLGRSLRILKTEVKSLHDDDSETDAHRRRAAAAGAAGRRGAARRRTGRELADGAAHSRRHPKAPGL